MDQSLSEHLARNMNSIGTSLPSKPHGFLIRDVGRAPSPSVFSGGATQLWRDTSWRRVRARGILGYVVLSVLGRPLGSMGPEMTANYSFSSGDHGCLGEEQRSGTVAVFCAVAEAAAPLPRVAV